MTTAQWHELEFIVRTGANGRVTVRLDGVVPSGLDLAEATGTAPEAPLQVGDHTAGRTYDLIVDDVKATSIP